MKHKKGQIAIDIMSILIILFIVGITFVIGYKALSEINTDIQADADFNSDVKANVQGVATNYPIFMDNAFFIMIILFWIIMIITSLFIDSNPIFFIISVVLLFFVFVIGMIMSNAYEDIMSDGELINFSDAFPKMSFVMNNLLLVIIVIGMTATLALYAKNNTGGLV